MWLGVDDNGQMHGYTADQREQAMLDRAGQRRPRRQMTDKHLRDVARTYREAIGQPTMAVMRRFATSRPTAGRWVMEARRRGYLAPVDAKGGAKPSKKARKR